MLQVHMPVDRNLPLAHCFTEKLSLNRLFRGLQHGVTDTPIEGITQGVLAGMPVSFGTVGPAVSLLLLWLHLLLLLLLGAHACCHAERSDSQATATHKLLCAGTIALDSVCSIAPVSISCQMDHGIQWTRRVAD